MVDLWREHRKAVVSGAIAGLMLVLSAWDDGISLTEWEMILAGVVTASGFTYAVPNKPKVTP